MRRYIYAVYKIYFTQKPNKMYIGIDSHFPDRKAQHLNRLRKGDHINKHLQAAFQKYGEINFCFELIEICECDKSMKQKEIEYIQLFNSFNKGFNLTLGGEGFVGRIFTAEHRRKITESNRGRKISESQKQKLRELYPTSELAKNKYIATPEVRKRIAIGYSQYCKKFGSPNLGRKFSDELKAKMKERCKGNKPPWTKLNEEKVTEIKRLLILNSISIENRKKLATQFGVDLQTINCITNNKTWKHVK